MESSELRIPLAHLSRYPTQTHEPLVSYRIPMMANTCYGAIQDAASLKLHQCQEVVFVAVANNRRYASMRQQPARKGRPIQATNGV